MAHFRYNEKQPKIVRNGKNEMDIHVIDDDESVRSILSRIAEKLNYRAKTFASADEYVKYMGRHEYLSPSLTILSDVDMPGMSGYELMDIVRKSHPDLRFIIVTGAAQRITGNNEYACFYFTKPVSKSELEKAFATQLTCVESGPAPDCFGCAAIGNPRDFLLEGWHCPLVTNQSPNRVGLVNQ